MNDMSPLLTSTHLDFERSTRELLVGRTIRNIEYIEADMSFLGEPNKRDYHTHLNGIDSINWGIRLYTSDGIVDISWDATFFHYGVNAFPLEASPLTEGKMVAWDVSDETLWKEFIGHKIVALSIFWEVVISEGLNIPKNSRDIYPQCFILRVATGAEAFISASEFIRKEDATAMCLMDNLLVTTNRTLAQEVKMFSGN